MYFNGALIKTTLFEQTSGLLNVENAVRFPSFLCVLASVPPP